MAGIGFHLKSVLDRNTYASVVEAYIYSALISTGPWLLSIAGLALINFLTKSLVTIDQGSLFRVMVVYTYMGTLLLTGPIQMGTTRFIADRLYINDVASLRPCFQWVGSIVLLASGLLSMFFYAFSGLSLSYALAGIILFQAVALCWTAMIYLSAAKDYMAIVRAFFLGYGLSVLASYWLGSQWGLGGLLWGFTLGQVALTGMLAARVAIEFPTNRSSDSLVALHWRDMPWLAAIGFLYNAGIWVDKIVFWLSPAESVHITGPFYTSRSYDVCLFLAYISIVPSMALFMIRIETGFYKHYATYYTAVTHGEGYQYISELKEEMSDALRLSVARLLKLQGAVSGALIFFTPKILEALGLAPEYTGLLRTAIIAAFVQVMLLILMIVLLYFDWRKAVGKVALLFFFSNLIFSIVSVYGPSKYFGFGYLLSCLISLCYGLFILEKRFKELEYETFTRQPILN